MALDIKSPDFSEDFVADFVFNSMEVDRSVQCYLNGRDASGVSVIFLANPSFTQNLWPRALKEDTDRGVIDTPAWNEKKARVFDHEHAERRVWLFQQYVPMER